LGAGCLAVSSLGGFLLSLRAGGWVGDLYGVPPPPDWLPWLALAALAGAASAWLAAAAVHAASPAPRGFRPRCPVPAQRAGSG
ncbi:MAG TPA: hypothetical protein VES42_16315, partial [Pilimelia sp.]|nr:hypothetical protein [Pilimelia sp.]